VTPWMLTYTGRVFHPTEPDQHEIDPRDIAHALSLTCRYGGHVRRFYSVAEHCVLMSRAVPEEHALWALLHDATEAYVGDVVRPLKRELPAYREIENRLMGEICKVFGLAPVMPDAVHEADNRILLDERAELLPPSPLPWGGGLEDLAPLGVKVRGLDPLTAETDYRVRLMELTGWKTL
jgi:uncharacterized protein